MKINLDWNVINIYNKKALDERGHVSFTTEEEAEDFLKWLKSDPLVKNIKITREGG